MLILMTSATCAGSCITMEISVTHRYMPYLLLFLCLPRKSVTSPVHSCSTQSGFNSLHAPLLGIIFDLLVFFSFSANFPSSATILIHDYPIACSLCLQKHSISPGSLPSFLMLLSGLPSLAIQHSRPAFSTQ